MYTESDRKDLKIEALRQKVAEYEDRIADLRVDLTLVTQERDIYKTQVETYETQKEDSVTQEGPDADGEALE